MNLVEIFLPLADNDGVPFSSTVYEAIERELIECFGGVTSYPRAPASGLWKASSHEKQRDDLVIYEVIVEDLVVTWWTEYRQRLEKAFRQEQLMIRSQPVQLL